MIKNKKSRENVLFLKILLTLVLNSFFSFCLFAQAETAIVGQIFDKHDKTPIPSVNVYFKNTQIGTTSNNEGYFLIRTWDTERTLVFSCVGYKSKNVKVKLGEPAYLNVELEEENTLLMDVFVLPGVNPALEWMKKIRLMRKANDIAYRPDFAMESTEQDLILLNKVNQQGINKRLLEQIGKGNLSSSDSTLLLPLYMVENKYQTIGRKKEQVSKNVFTTSDVADKVVVQLLGGLSSEMNFYENSVAIFGKSIISPLSSIGNSYYRYYLTDSIGVGSQKQYEISFLSKNPKNLAFDGKFRFDSTSLALTYIEAQLPKKANINYIHNFAVKQEFEALTEHVWTPKNEELALSMTYEFKTDSVNSKPELLIKRATNFSIKDSVYIAENFAKSEFDTQTLEEKISELDNAPLIRTAKWIADAALTGHAQVGVIDVGNLQQVIRLTDIEGFRVTAPLHTNERLWKNVSLGGSVGYGFKDKQIKYSAMAKFRLPTEKRRVFALSYTDDYRRVDYDYNNFIARENPWSLGDDDAVNTFFSLHSGGKINPRKEWSFSFSNDWSKNVESMIYLRANRIYANNVFPLSSAGVNYDYLGQQSVSLITRISFDEKKYDDHLQRIYLGGSKPVVYITIEGGRTQMAKEEYYGKFSASLKQDVRLDLGRWEYAVEGGFILGQVPYPLLKLPAGNEPNGISFYNFNRMKYMEFASDKYLQIQNEFVFNGILFNNIPLIKYLNLREIVGLKAFWGGLSDKHRNVLDFPDPTLYPYYLHQTKVPYVEASVGVMNLFRIIRIQMNWRLTNVYQGVSPLRVTAGLRFDF